jgi:SHS2 domain-containing protein
MYELFDHTADLGLRVTAATLDELFADAARGLFAMIVERPDAIEPRVDVKFDIPGEDKAFLLFDWLRALLTTSEIDGVVFGEFTVTVRDNGITATAWGEPLDPAKHGLGREVKAITYHELKVEQTRTGWLAEVIVDI